MEDIQIQMLGGFILRRGDREAVISGRSRKLCLLLTRLILERDRPVPNEELVRLLWEGQESGADALNALKATLHRARTHLDRLGAGMGRTLLISRAGCCQWNPKPRLTVDTECFRLLCSPAAGPEERLTGRLEGLALYAGDFLPGLDSHPWVISIREELRGLFLQTTLEVLPLLDARDLWTQAAELTEKALLLDSCSDALCRWRMRALLHLGRREEAAQTYEDFQERLLARLGVMPSDSLRELYREVRRDRDPRAVSPVTLLERLREPPRPGALFCEYDFFRVICHSMVRMAGRSGEPLHIALLSVESDGDAPLPRHSLDRCMDNLQGIILRHLRQGDAASRCSASQFVLLLPQASYENGLQICTRITRAFSRQFPHSPAVLRVSVQSLLAEL